MSVKCECMDCHCKFTPWQNEDGELIDDICWLCNQDREMGAVEDSLIDERKL